MTFRDALIDVVLPVWILGDLLLPVAGELAREIRWVGCRRLWRWRSRWETLSMIVWATYACTIWPGPTWGPPLVALVAVLNIVYLVRHGTPLVVWFLSMKFDRPGGIPLEVRWGNLPTVLAERARHGSHDEDCKYGPRRRRERGRVRLRLSWPKVVIRPAFGAT